MRNLIQQFLILNFITAALLFTSCGSDPVTGSNNNNNTSGNVSGRVVDESGNGLQNVRVDIGGQNTPTAPDGTFAIPNVASTYDMSVISALGVGIVYKNVTTRTPTVLGIGIPVTPNQCNLTVSIPPSRINNSQHAAVIFTDALSIQASGIIHGENNETSVPFNVKWKGATSITGKIIVLVYTIDSAQHIVTNGFERYSDKPYTVNNGSNSTVTFLENEFLTSPTPSTIAGSVIPPPPPHIWTNVTADLSISFITANNYETQNLSTSSTLLDSKPAPAFTFNVPAGLAVTNKLIITGSADQSSMFSGLNNKTDKILVCAPGSTGNTIQLETIPDLISPPDGAPLIDTNNVFSFNAGTGAGLYLVRYHNQNNTRTFYVFTSLTSCRIPNLTVYGLHILYNEPYTWEVLQLLGITSTNDVLSVPIINNNHFLGTTRTAQRNFTTIPPP